MWEPQLALAEHGWRVIAPHLGGAAGGAVSSPPPTMDDLAGEVIDLLDALHIKDAVVCGLSMGGYVALTLVRHAARYIRGLILADTRSQADTPEGIEGRKRMIALVREKGAAAIADEMLPKLLGEGTRARHPEIADRVRQMILSNSTDAIAGAINALMTRADSTALLASIHVPTLIMVGDGDAITPPALSDGLHKAIAGSELVTIKESGHLSSVEQPDAFNDAVARFLEHRV